MTPPNKDFLLENKKSTAFYDFFQGNEKSHIIPLCKEYGLSDHDQQILVNHCNLRDALLKASYIKQLDLIIDDEEHSYYEYELIEIIVNNPFYLYNISFEKMIKLIEYSYNLLGIITIYFSYEKAHIAYNVPMEKIDKLISKDKVFWLKPRGKKLSKYEWSQIMDKNDIMLGLRLKDCKKAIIKAIAISAANFYSAVNNSTNTSTNETI